jgi:tetratricopeptide (TPR) repeat protein
LAALCGVAGAQAPSPGAPAASPRAADPGQSAQEIASRNALLKPGLDALNKGDFAGAVLALQPALVAMPNDPQVLSVAATANFAAKHGEEALELFQRAAAHADNPWPARTGILQALAMLGRWDEFDKDLAELRAAKKAGTDHGLDRSTGFVIDQFSSSKGPVQAVVFPLGAGRFHTLYRFLLPKEANANAQVQASTTANGQNPRCQNPDFQPFIDAESDDIDQMEFKKSFPDKAARGERSYSLDSYPGPCTQGLIKFYSDGEPKYETVRADVRNTLAYVPPAAPAAPAAPVKP